MSSLTRERRAARLLALDVLYQAEIREQLPTEALSLQRREGWAITLPDVDQGPQDPPAEAAILYATGLIEGVQQNLSQIDALIDHYAERWAIERMPIIDKNLLRLALFELLWVPEVPTAVVINEAVELAKSFSTDDSGRFVNGILGRVASDDAARPDPSEGDQV